MMSVRQQPLVLPYRVLNRARLQHGFTLIELMIVIVIVAILAAMVALSVDGSDNRKIMQEREQLQDAIAEIRLESVDQGRMLGLVPLLQTATDPARYVVVQFDPLETNKDKRWHLTNDFKIHDLPKGVELSIAPLQNSTRQNQATALERFKVDSELNPQMIWFGNGEATAARLQLSRDGQPIGEAIEVTTLGRVFKDSGQQSVAGSLNNTESSR